MWDERYSVEDYVFGTEPSGFLTRRDHWLKRGAKALCVADGEGRNSVYLAEQGLQVTAWDGSASRGRQGAQAGHGAGRRGRLFGAGRLRVGLARGGL